MTNHQDPLVRNQQVVGSTPASGFPHSSHPFRAQVEGAREWLSRTSATRPRARRVQLPPTSKLRALGVEALHAEQGSHGIGLRCGELFFEVVDTREARHFGRGWRGLLGIARALEARAGWRAEAFARGEATPKMRRDGLARFAEEYLAGHATCDPRGLGPVDLLEHANELLTGKQGYPCETLRTIAVRLGLVDARGTHCAAPLYPASRIISGWGLDDAPAGWRGSWPYQHGIWDAEEFGPPDDPLDTYELSSRCVEEVRDAH